MSKGMISDLKFYLELEKPVEALPHKEEAVDFREQGEWQRVLRQLEKRVEYKEQEYIRLQQKRAQYLRGKLTCEKLLLSGTIQQRAWLELRLKKLNARLETCSRLKLLQIQAKIAGLKKEVEVVRGDSTKF